MCTAGSSRFWQCSGQRSGRSVCLGVGGGGVTDWVCYCWQTDYIQRGEQWALMYQHTREREGETGCARPSLIHPPPPPSCIKEEGYPSFPSSQHRDHLSAVSPPAASHYKLGHDIRHLHWKSLFSAYKSAGLHFFHLNSCYHMISYTFEYHYCTVTCYELTPICLCEGEQLLLTNNKL